MAWTRCESVSSHWENKWKCGLWIFKTWSNQSVLGSCLTCLDCAKYWKRSISATVYPLKLTWPCLMTPQANHISLFRYPIISPKYPHKMVTICFFTMENCPMSLDDLMIFFTLLKIVIFHCKLLVYQRLITTWSPLIAIWSPYDHHMIYHPHNPHLWSPRNSWIYRGIYPQAEIPTKSPAESPDV